MEELIRPTNLPARGGARVRSGLAMVSILVLAGTALVDRIWPAMPPRLVGQEKAEYAAARRQRNLRDGSYARWIEKEAATRSRTRVVLGPWWSMVMLGLGDSIKKDLVTGSDGWLFLRRRAELDEETLEGAPTVAVNTLLALRRRLALHGCDVRFLPIPRKAAACAARLPAGFAAHTAFDAEVIERLISSGAPTIDLLRAWRGLAPEDLYMRLDTHWEVGGQEAAARAIAAQFGDLRGSLGAIELVRTEEPGPAALLRFAGFYKGYAAWDHMNDAPLHRVRLASEDLQRRLAGPGAAGGERSDVALAGTSFTGHLALHPLVVEELEAPVVKVASDGAAFTEPVEVLLKRWAAEASLPDVLLLEFPIFQVVDAFKQRKSVTRALGSIVQRLDLPAGTALVLPTRAIHREAKAGRKGAQMRASLRPGAVLSSGDGVVQLRVEVASAEPTRWSVRTAAMDVPIRFDAGGGIAWVPLIEGATWVGRVQVFSLDAAAHVADLTVEPVLEPAESMSITLEDPRVDVEAHDILLLDWSGTRPQDPPAEVSIRLEGTRADGGPVAIRRSFQGAVGTWAALDLGPFTAGRLDRIGVDGALRMVGASLYRRRQPE